MSFEYSRERKVAKDWLENNPKGSKKTRYVIRGEDSIHMDYFNIPLSSQDESSAVAIKTPKKNPEKIFFNSDIFDTRRQIFTTRAGAILEVIKQYCASSECSLYRLPFSIARSARFPLRKVSVIDKTDDTVLFEYNNKKILIGTDGWGTGDAGPVWFGSLVSSDNENIADAIEFLKPEEVKIAEKEVSDIMRQGEWFFIKREGLDDMLDDNWLQKKLYKNSKMSGYPLPHKNDGNVHIANRGCVFNGKTYVTGSIRHHYPKKNLEIFRFGTEMSTGQHRMIKLDGVWMAVQNNSLGNYSSAGFFNNGRRNVD